MGVKDEIRPVGPSFNQILAMLAQLAPGQMIPVGVVRGLSDLFPSQAEALIPIWRSLASEIKRDIMSALVEAGESDFETDYEIFGTLALEDDDPDVRRMAVDLTAFVTGQSHMQRLFEIAQQDSIQDVRAAAIKGLAPFVLESELGGFPQAQIEPVIEYLLAVLSDRQADSDLRASALETASYSGGKDVEAEIMRAYQGDDPRMKTSAIFAMGASSDDQWAEYVMQELEHGKAENRFQAARAAGELQLNEAVRPLSQMALGDDRELMEMAVWSLGEIGGKEAVRVLEALLERTSDEDDDLADLVEDALDNASAADGVLYGFDGSDLD